MDNHGQERWNNLYNFSKFINKDIAHQKYNSQFDILIKVISEQPLPAIVTLHHYKSLSPLLKTAAKIFHNQNAYQAKFISKISQIIGIIYTTAYQCLLIHLIDDKYKDLFSQLQTKMKVYDLKQIKNRQILHINLINNLFKIQTQYQAQLKRKQINKYINQQLLVQQPETYCQEVFFNWIKKQIQNMQHEDQSKVCCRVHFQHDMTSKLSKFQQSSYHQFKDYHWPLQNDSIKFHLTKTIVGFMNTTGGIIFVGLKEDKQKIMIVNGIKLTKKQKIDFLYFLHNQILNGVYPKDIKDNNLSLSDYELRLKQEFDFNKKKKIKEFRINKYVYVDFMDVYDNDTLLNKRKDGCNLYIVRIKVKIGDYKELYHVLNKEKQIPEAFVRAEKSVKKKVLKEFFDQFYKRMTTTNQIAAQVINPHPNCRFNAKCTQQ